MEPITESKKLKLLTEEELPSKIEILMKDTNENIRKLGKELKKGLDTGFENLNALLGEISKLLLIGALTPFILLIVLSVLAIAMITVPSAIIITALSNQKRFIKSRAKADEVTKSYFTAVNNLIANDLTQSVSLEAIFENALEPYGDELQNGVTEKVITGKDVTVDDSVLKQIMHDDKLSLTSASYDDMQAKQVGIYDDNYMLKIIESDDVVAMYNAYIDLNFDRLKKILQMSEQDMQKEGTNLIVSPIDVSILNESVELLQSGKIKSEEQLRKYITQKYFEVTDDPEILRSTLRLRYNWNKKVTSLLQRMLKDNYQLLGYTEDQAQKMVDNLTSGDVNKKRETVDDIVEDILKSPNSPMFNSDRTELDLSSVGGGKVYASYDLAKLSNNTDASLFRTAIMYAFRYDIVITAHGIGNSIVTNDKSIYRNLISKSSMDDFSYAYINTFGKEFPKPERDDSDIIKYAFKSINSLEQNYPRLKNIHDIDMLCYRYIYLNKMRNRLIKEGIVHGDYGDMRLTDSKYFTERQSQILTNEIDDYLVMFQSFIDRPDIVEEYNIIDKYYKYYMTIMKSRFDNNEIWFSQRTKIGNQDPTMDTVKMIRNAIKENPKAKTIMVINCNPDHIKLPADLINDKKHLIHISNNNTLGDVTTSYSFNKEYVSPQSRISTESFIAEYLCESVDYQYSNEEFDRILEQTENDLKQFALENDIDYYDNDILMEAVELVENSDYVMEGVISSIWKAVLKFIKSVIKALIALFKAVINFFKSIFNLIRNLLRALVGKPPIQKNISYIAMESADVREFKPRDNKDIENKLKKSCEDMGRELQILSRLQTRISKEIEKEAERKAKEDMKAANEGANLWYDGESWSILTEAPKPKEDTEEETPEEDTPEEDTEPEEDESTDYTEDVDSPDEEEARDADMTANDFTGDVVNPDDEETPEQDTPEETPEDEQPEDYTGEVEPTDDTGETPEDTGTEDTGEETPEDYTADAEPTDDTAGGEDIAPEGEDIPTDGTGEDIPADGEVPEEEPQDFTADVDGGADDTGEDTTDDTGEETTDDTTDDTTETGEDNNNLENSIVKNYNLMVDYRKMYSTIDDILKHLKTVTYTTTIQNSVLDRCVNNLTKVKDELLAYIEFNYSNDYNQNLYYYSTFVQALKLNLDVLRSIKKLTEETKQ